MMKSFSLFIHRQQFGAERVSAPQPQVWEGYTFVLIGRMYFWIEKVLSIQAVLFGRLHDQMPKFTKPFHFKIE